MSLQIRVRIPENLSGAVIAHEIARLFEDTAQQILTGVPPDKYPGAVERYKVLFELSRFIEDRIAEEAKGEETVGDA